MHIGYVANGMGSQSMYLLYLAAQKRIPATISITADTGWENDCDLNDGTKTTALRFFNEQLKPLADSWGIDAYFVRAVDNKGVPLPPLPEYLALAAERGKAGPVPLFGSKNGRLMQSCTEKWKIRAMRQQLRRMGATTASSAQGILWSERSRRVKGIYAGNENGYDLYRTAYTDGKGKVIETKWLTHYYPLVDLKMNREDVRAECDRLNIPYLISSECAGCPHADPWRWLRRSPGTIQQLVQLERSFNGEYFFTQGLKPLDETVAAMRKAADAQGNLFDIADFGCTDGVCGV